MPEDLQLNVFRLEGMTDTSAPVSIKKVTLFDLSSTFKRLMEWDLGCSLPESSADMWRQFRTVKFESVAESLNLHGERQYLAFAPNFQ